MEDSKPIDHAQLLITVDDAARRLSLSTRSIWKQIAAQRLPVVKIGRSTRVRVADLEKFIAGEVG